MEAIELDSSQAVRDALLGENPPDINLKGAGGQTPVMTACLKGKANAVDALIAGGADLTIGEDKGYTCVHGAAFQGRPEVIDVLEAHGVSLSDRHRDGFTPIHRACWGRRAGHAQVVRRLLKYGVDPEEITGEGHEPLDICENADARHDLVVAKARKHGGTQHDEL